MDRRNFLKGILAAGVAPYVITTAGVLMPVRQIVVPPAIVGIDRATYPWWKNQAAVVWTEDDMRRAVAEMFEQSKKPTAFHISHEAIAALESLLPKA